MRIISKITDAVSNALARAGARIDATAPVQMTESRRSIRRHMVAGLAIVIVLAGGVGGWAGTTKLSGAIIAPGLIVVDSNVKKVQHPTGGIVGQVLVHDGDKVKAGQVLVRLDDTVTRANLAIVTKGLTELTARKARLESERDGDDNVKFPSELLAQANNPDVADIMDGERKLFELRRSARIGQKAQLRQRVVQLKEEIRGFNAQKESKERQIALIKREASGVEDLCETEARAAHEGDGAATRGGTARRRSRPIDRADSRGQRARFRKPNWRLSRLTGIFPAKSLRKRARSTARSASSSNARSLPKISSSGSTSARRRTAWCFNPRCTRSAVSSPPAMRSC